MNDIIIFAFGCVVTLFVASAVGLLLWGAANEPSQRLAPARESGSPKASPRSARSGPDPEPSGGLGSRSPV